MKRHTLTIHQFRTIIAFLHIHTGDKRLYTLNLCLSEAKKFLTRPNRTLKRLAANILIREAASTKNEYYLTQGGKEILQGWEKNRTIKTYIKYFVEDIMKNSWYKRDCDRHTKKSCEIAMGAYIACMDIVQKSTFAETRAQARVNLIKLLNEFKITSLIEFLFTVNNAKFFDFDNETIVEKSFFDHKQEITITKTYNGQTTPTNVAIVPNVYEKKKLIDKGDFCGVHCTACGGHGNWCAAYLTATIEDLENLARALLTGANKMSLGPQNTIQPFLSIIVDNANIIKKHKLL